ncbi:MAG: MFS transporter, partial [Dehalococcoidales bacterium]|nr:MFS transporter [Dehalococcoidales bacterium]
FKAVLFTRMKDVSDPTKRYVRFGLSDFVEETKKGSLGRFIVYVSMLNFAVYLSSPFFAVYMVSELHFSYTTFAVIFSADFIARALSASYWGKYSDRIGALPLLERISYLIPVIPVLWLVSSNVIYLLCIQLFSGVVWAGFEVCSQSLIYKSASPEKRGGYIIYQRGLTMMGQAFGALVGAAIFGFMIPLFGSKILGLFLLSGILRLVVARIILPGMTQDRPPVPERHGPTKTPGIYTRPEHWPAYVKNFVTRHPIEPSAPKARPAFGLYHMRHERGCFAECRASTVESKSVPLVAARGLLHVRQSEAYFAEPQKVAVAAAVKAEPARGLYHEPQQWSASVGQTAAQLGSNQAVPAHGLLHEREAWCAYRGQLNKRILTPESVAAHGLFHQPEKWVAYRRQTAKQNEAVPASGIFHNPEQWAEVVRSTSVAPARKLEKIYRPIKVKTVRLPGKLAPALAYA